jgi:small-conductance mechanosensitive channel
MTTHATLNPSIPALTNSTPSISNHHHSQQHHSNAPTTGGNDSVYPWMTIRNENDREKRQAIDKYQLSQLNNNNSSRAQQQPQQQQTAANKRSSPHTHKPFNPMIAQELDDKFRRAQYRIMQEKERLRFGGI